MFLNDISQQKMHDKSCVFADTYHVCVVSISC